MQITRDLLYTISSIAPLIHWVRPSIYLSYPAAAAIYNIQSRYHARRGLTISGSILRINRGDVGKRRDNYSHEFWPGPAQGERAGWLAGTSPPVTLLLLPPSQFAETAQVVVTRTKDPSLSLLPVLSSQRQLLSSIRNSCAYPSDRPISPPTAPKTTDCKTHGETLLLLLLLLPSKRD